MAHELGQVLLERVAEDLEVFQLEGLHAGLVVSALLEFVFVGVVFSKGQPVSFGVVK